METVPMAGPSAWSGECVLMGEASPDGPHCVLELDPPMRPGLPPAPAGQFLTSTAAGKEA